MVLGSRIGGWHPIVGQEGIRIDHPEVCGVVRSTEWWNVIDLESPFFFGSCAGITSLGGWLTAVFCFWGSITIGERSGATGLALMDGVYRSRTIDCVLVDESLESRG